MEPDDKSAAIEEIAAAIAHEVKNPLTMVTANIDILESTDSRDSTNKNYAMIRKELKKINDIMMDFIDLTQKSHREKDIVYIVDLLASILAEMEPALPDVTMEINYTDADLALLGNEVGIRILFNNIIKNALEAMDFHGKITIRATKANHMVIISVEDSGPGLSPEAEQKIFTEYFTTKPSGSGLGLGICRKIAEEHDGSFILKQAPEGGCIATVAIPSYTE